MGWYQKHRPQKFSEIKGQDQAVKVLLEKVRGKCLPHALLFVGPSGVGKTTLGRILKGKLECDDVDYFEVNAAEARGIDDIRSIKNRMQLAPFGAGKCRIWHIDEAARLTPDAQSCLLKILEDTPSHVYFILCTTDPQKLLKTIRTRCMEVALGDVPAADLLTLVAVVAGKEGHVFAPDLCERIAEVAEGSARKALVLAEQVAGLPEGERLEAVQKADTKKAAIDLCRILMNPKAQWKDVAKVLAACEDEPENLRRAVLGYAASVLLKGDGKGFGAGRAKMLILEFEKNVFDSGKAGLVGRCHEVFSDGK